MKSAGVKKMMRKSKTLKKENSNKSRIKERITYESWNNLTVTILIWNYESYAVIYLFIHLFAENNFTLRKVNIVVLIPFEKHKYVYQEERNSQRKKKKKEKITESNLVFSAVRMHQTLGY